MSRQLNTDHRSWLATAIVIIALAMSTTQIASAQVQNANSPQSAEAGAGDFYRPDEVQSVYLSVTDADQQRMRAALPERISVPASFRWRDHTVTNATVRFKGNSSSMPQQQHKRSFLVRFNEDDKDQRFLGMRRISFDNAVQFGSVFSEPVMTDILNDLGIKHHRSNYARLFVNEKYQGIYVNVERIDESFIESHLPDENGLLFKVDEGGPGCDLRFLGDNPAAYARTFEPMTKSAKKGHQQLVEFIRMINQSKPDEIASILQDRLELDDFLRVSAVMLLSGAFDQLTGWNPHNYYLYLDGKQNRWRYLPWDLDVGFSEVAFGHIRVLEDWNAAWPLAGQLPNPLVERIIAEPVLLQRYRDFARIILEKYFEPDRLCKVIDGKYALIKNDLKSDPFPHRRITSPDDRSYDDIIASIKTFVRRRYMSVREQLANPGPRPPMGRRPEGRPELAEKIQRVIQAAEKMQQNGEDVRPIQKLMQKIGPLLDQGKVEPAEKLVLEALKLTGDDSEKENPSPPRDK